MKNLTWACGAVFIACGSTDLLAEVEAHLAESHPKPARPSVNDAGTSISEHSLEPEDAT